MEQSKELTAFYDAYLNWLERGAPNYDPFKRSLGLCNNLRRWMGIVGSAARHEMTTQFKAAGLDESYPFDPTEPYGLDFKHDNPARIEWVRAHATPRNNTTPVQQSGPVL